MDDYIDDMEAYFEEEYDIMVTENSKVYGKKKAKDKPISEYSTIGVKFYNKYHNNFTGNIYKYGIENELYNLVSLGDEFKITTPSGLNKIKVVDKWNYIHSEVSKDIGYDMISGQNIVAFKEAVKKLNKKEGNNMNTNMKNMMKRFMTEVENVGLNMTDGKIGIKKDGSVFTLGANGVEENMFDFMSFDIPAFGVSTPVDAVKEGDIVVENGRAIGWVTKEFNKETNKLEITRITGTKYGMNPPENKTFGTKNVMVVKNMFGDMSNMNMQNVMMMQLMGEGGMDKEKMMMLMMMQNMQNLPAQENNPMGNMGMMLPMMMFMNK